MENQKFKTKMRTALIVAGSLVTISLVFAAVVLYHQKEETLRSKVAECQDQGAKTSFVNGEAIVQEASVQCIAAKGEKGRVAKSLGQNATALVIVGVILGSVTTIIGLGTKMASNKNRRDGHAKKRQRK